MLFAAVGQAECVNGRSAARLAAAQVRNRLGDDQPDLLLLFAASDFEAGDVLEEVAAAFPDAPLLGCTTAGELSSALGFSDDSLALLALRSENIRFSVGLGRGLAADPAGAVEACVNQARAGLPGEASLALLLCTPEFGQADRVVSHAGRALRNTPLYGGVAGLSLDAMGRPSLFFGQQEVPDAVAVALLHGPVKASAVITRSFEPIGMRARVEAADGARILRIGDMSALDFYRRHLGERSEPAFEFPLAVYDQEGRFTIRTPQAWSEKDGSVELTGPVEIGTMVQLTESSRQTMVEDTEQAIHDCLEDYGPSGPPALALLFSCSTRKQILGTRVRMEQELLGRLLPAGVPSFGFYSSGEIAPLVPGGPPMLHNCTLVSVLLGPGPASRTPAAAPASEVQACEEDPGEAGLQRRVAFLSRKLARSERYRERLEQAKELGTTLLRKVNQDINDARLAIEHKNEIVREALDLAREVHASLLPRRGPDIPGLEVAGQSIPCQEAGGDFFDYLQPEGEQGPLTIAVGDVTGHGVAASLLMASARAFLRMRASQGAQPAELATDVNVQLTRDVYESGRFLTLALIQPRPDDGRLIFVRAGHDPAMACDPESGEFQDLMGHGGLPLGLEPETPYLQSEHPLPPGRLVLLGTDGIWETHDDKGEMYGKERMRQVVRAKAHASCAGIVSAVLQDVTRFRGGQAQEDDLTLVALRALPR